ncbi:MAG: DNA methyltransferase [Rhizomicrobium sp.]
MNTLYYGDNLDVLRRHVAADSVDLIYLDPPFQSGRDYNILFEEQDGTKAAAQIQAFEDSWEWDLRAAAAYDDVVRAGGAVANALEAFRQLLGGTPMLAYLSMMAPRLVELRRVLRPTGSIYLHCDVTASAHLRLLMDAVFGPRNFRNEIVWYYYNKMHDSRKRLFPRATDTLLFYVKDVHAPFTYRQLKEQREKPVRQLARKKLGGRMVNARDEDGHVIYRLKEDRTIDNVWRIPCIQPADRTQRMGYPTQKPEALLARVVEASSNAGDTVLDPFCGCGTAIAVAQQMNRHWIGIDVTHLAVGLIKHRLLHAFGLHAKKDYAVIGEPTTIDGAKQLAEDDRHQFEHWALGLVGARASAKGKGADRGIDGQLSFQEGGTGSEHKRVFISVKSGGVKAGDIRDLRGVVERENAAMGWLITLEEPSRPMRAEAADAGFYVSPWGQHGRLQILTAEALLDGATFSCPPIRPSGTTFKLPRRATREADQGALSLEGPAADEE